MKFTIISFQALLFSSLFLLTNSCKKTEEEPVVPDSQEPITFVSSFSAKIDDVPFDVQTYFGNYDANSSTITIGAATDDVGAIADSTHFVGFTVPSNIAVGTFSFSGGAITGYYNVGLDDQDKYEASSGTLVVTSHNTTDHKITGTFSFMAVPIPQNTNTNVFEISGGHFAINY